jgi:hypothetical protein
MSADLNILGDPQQVQAALRTDGTAVNGIQKLVQRALLLLYTDVEDPIRLGVGTDLSQSDQSRNAYDTEELRNIFAIALGKVKDILLVTTALDAPDDEKIREFQTEAELTDRGVISVTITVQTQADTAFVVQVPVTTVSEVA